ncbi:MAG: hypothetical protein P1V13_22325 [Rhizobiaceae bacterium]|nr:hypothetical protein [Rhizobiaceae bacterium]
MDDDVDIELVALQSMIDGGSMAHIALALALIDRGVIDKDRLLSIIGSLRTILEATYHERLGESDDATVVLDLVDDFLSSSVLTAGRVVEDLRRQESEAYRALQRILARRKRDRGDPAPDSA